jgi:hypothetical protein
MRRSTLLELAGGLALAMLPPTVSAVQRTFVSGNGNDANACSLVAPCRSFAAAIQQTSGGGEVIVLDAAGYGPVAILSSVSIIAPPGVYAGISVSAGAGVTVNAGGASTVVLRNLTIVGLGGSSGILAVNVGKLRIEGVHVSGFTGAAYYGLAFQTAGSLSVVNSAFEGNFQGILIAPPSGQTATVVVEDTQLVHNAQGYYQSGVGTTNATLTRVNASANSLDGIVVSNATAGGVLAVDSCTASNNTAWGIALQTAKLVLSNSTIVKNGTGVYTTGSATAQSRGNNTILQNASDINGSLPVVPGL